MFINFEKYPGLKEAHQFLEKVIESSFSEEDVFVCGETAKAVYLGSQVNSIDICIFVYAYDPFDLICQIMRLSYSLFESGFESYYAYEGNFDDFCCVAAIESGGYNFYLIDKQNDIVNYVETFEKEKNQVWLEWKDKGFELHKTEKFVNSLQRNNKM